MNSESKVLLCVLAGAATGGLIGVLFATEKGTETRKRLVQGSRNMANNLKDKLSEVADDFAHKFECVKEAADDLIEKRKQKVGMSSANPPVDVLPTLM